MDHFDGRRFYNPIVSGAPEADQRLGVQDEPTPGDLWSLMRSPRSKWPRSVPVQQIRPLSPGDGELVITYIGHATFLLQSAAGTVLTDPVFSDWAGPLPYMGPRRVRKPGVAFSDLPPIDLVLLSHNHYDHCDAGAIRSLAKRFNPRFVTPLGNAPLLRSLGVHEITELDWWDRIEVDGFDITATPAQHFSARTPFDRNRALWSGFALAVERHRVYFAGDSGYGPHFRQIGERLGPFDLGLIPIGAYDPRWFMKPIHMNPEEAVQAHIDVRSAKSIGMHHGVFRLTTEPIDEPARRLASDLADRGLPADTFTAPEPGEHVVLEPGR